MSVAIQGLPSSSRDASRLAVRLGVPFHEIAIHTFPDGEARVTVGPASSTTIIYSAAARRRQAPGAAGAVSLLHAAGCGLP
jgi:ribose-phosphate pyrophosphokinase